MSRLDEIGWLIRTTAEETEAEPTVEAPVDNPMIHDDGGEWELIRVSRA